MLLNFSKRINGNLHNAAGGFDLLPPKEQFRRTLDKERERADRSDSHFAVIVLDMGGERVAERMFQDVVKLVMRRVRNIDEVGWFDDASIGVILPYTRRDGAQRLAENLHERIANLGVGLSYRVYVYPAR